MRERVSDEHYRPRRRYAVLLLWEHRLWGMIGAMERTARSTKWFHFACTVEIDPKVKPEGGQF